MHYNIFLEKNNVVVCIFDYSNIVLENKNIKLQIKWIYEIWGDFWNLDDISVEHITKISIQSNLSPQTLF